jgi:hypothetical protein
MDIRGANYKFLGKEPSAALKINEIQDFKFRKKFDSFV